MRPTYEVRCFQDQKRLPNCETVQDFATVTEAHKRIYHAPVEDAFERHMYEHSSPGKRDAGPIDECEADVCVKALRENPLLKLMVDA